MNPDRRLTASFHRVAIWSVLLLFAAFFLLPLYVMVATSLKDMAEVRDGSLLSTHCSLSFRSFSRR